MGTLNRLGLMRVSRHKELMAIEESLYLKCVSGYQTQLLDSERKIAQLEQEKKELLTRLEEKIDTKPHRAKNAAEIRRAFNALNAQVEVNVTPEKRL